MDEEVKLMNKVLLEQNYNVLAKLSQGSYGEIFLVQSKQLKEKFVLKALSVQKLKKQQRMHEAFVQSMLLRKLKHPGIIRLFETIQRQSYFNQVLQYCPNGDVYKLIAQSNHDLNLIKKKKEVMKFYLAQILQALSYLHEQSIIHRDLKPENIVLAKDLHIKLIDFGTAFISNDQYLNQKQKDLLFELKISDKELVGSAHYLSPQALKFQYSDKSDIWAFGVIAYKFYHNSLPFVGANNFQIFRNIKEKHLKLDESLPLDVKELIESCLKKDASQRPTAFMLKYYSFFKPIAFDLLFASTPPITSQELHVPHEVNLQNLNLSPSKKKALDEQLYSGVLEKKMFFGNYKPRILSVYRKTGALYFAYKYVDTKIIKNQVQLNMNDYCQKVSKYELQIKTADGKQYVFKCQQIQSIQKIVDEINSIIREHFKLQ